MVNTIPGARQCRKRAHIHFNQRRAHAALPVVIQIALHGLEPVSVSANHAVCDGFSTATGVLTRMLRSCLLLHVEV